MKFKQHKIADTDIIVYDGEYNNQKYRITKSTDKGGNIWILMKYYKNTNTYQNLNWSTPNAVKQFINLVSKQIEDGTI